MKRCLPDRGAALLPILLACAFQGCSCSGKEDLSGDGSGEEIAAEEGPESLPDTGDLDGFEDIMGDESGPDPSDVTAEELEPPAYWSRTYRTGNLTPWATASPAGGYLLIGNPIRDLVMRLDALGNPSLCTRYGQARDNIMYRIAQFDADRFLTLGEINTHYSSDVWLMELDVEGEILRQKAYRGLGGENAKTVLPTGDGGFILSGWTTSFGAGGWDGLVIRLDSAMNVLWQYCYGGESSDDLKLMEPAEGGGFVLSGETASFGEGGTDIWIVRIDDSGEILRQKEYGGPMPENVLSLDSAPAGGYVVSGTSNSFGEGQDDFWVVRIDEEGNVVWQKSLGTPDLEDSAVARSTSDGGFIVAGGTQPADYGRGILVKLDENGDVEWQKSYGVYGFTYGADGVEQDMDGGFFVWGYAFSNTAGESVWLMRVDASGDISPDCPPGFVTEASLVATDTGAVPHDTDARRTFPTLWVIDTDAVAAECDAIDVETVCDSE
jgi:hypothetical protein